MLDPETGKCRNIIVALVGLHIIHKTSSQTSWVWATFEHVDNAPDDAAQPSTAPPAGGYNFYNPNCRPQVISDVPASCLPDGGSSPVTVGCTPNTPPPYYLTSGCPKPVPIQVTRVSPIDPTTRTVNQQVQANIQSTNPGSVWQYYQLVNTIWSTSAPPAPSSPQKVSDVTLMGMQPSGIYPPPVTTHIANTVLETYVQKSTCIQCHSKASLATSDNEWFADFSFLLGNAQSPPAAASSLNAHRHPLR